MKNIYKSSRDASLAFTMVEVIFVIIVIGILSYVGSSFMPDNRLTNDTKFIILKIRQKQKSAIGYSRVDFGDNPWRIEDNSTCIELSRDSINKSEIGSNEQKRYRLVSNIVMSGDRTICFDGMGRPYRPLEEHLLLKNLEINVTKDDKIRRIKLFSITGYVIIEN